jgi:electron transfer flavoprotein alpha subunit
MTTTSWVLATDTRRLAAMVSAVRGIGGSVTVAAVGPRALADAAARAGADAVAWIETGSGVPPEACAASLAAAVASTAPRAVIATTTPEGRALLGPVAIALGAVIVTGARALALDGDAVVVERTDLGGRVDQALATSAPLAALFGGDDVPAPAGATAPIERVEGAASDVRVERLAPVPGATGGVTTAERVVSVGRGLKAKADLPMVEELAAALGAEIACSMPIADDYGWVAKERYVGRSGQHIAPRLYLALGISGTPQHLEGVRDAKVVVAVNSDPAAHIFGRAAYGIVGDLYEVIPALRTALGK